MESIHIFKTEQELLNAVAAYFIKTATKFIDTTNQFNVALSGGHSPQKLYVLLSSYHYKNIVDWKKINFFFGDERYVPENDLQRNSLMAKHYLFDPLQITDAHIFKIDATLSPEEAALKYDKMISTHFKSKPVSFDLILLGLGDNAHTASLFPFTNILSEKTAMVKSVFIKEQNQYRITMTAPLINQAKQIAFLVFGKEKAEAVHHVLDDAINIEKYPAQLIHPLKGELYWFLDESAAALIRKKI